MALTTWQPIGDYTYSNLYCIDEVFQHILTPVPSYSYDVWMCYHLNLKTYLNCQKASHRLWLTHDGLISFIFEFFTFPFGTSTLAGFETLIVVHCNSHCVTAWPILYILNIIYYGTKLSPGMVFKLFFATESINDHNTKNRLQSYQSVDQIIIKHKSQIQRSMWHCG